MYNITSTKFFLFLIVLVLLVGSKDEFVFKFSLDFINSCSHEKSKSHFATLVGIYLSCIRWLDGNDLVFGAGKSESIVFTWKRHWNLQPLLLGGTG